VGHDTAAAGPYATLEGMRIEARLAELGLVVPAAMQTPAGVRLPFTNVRVRGNRAFVAGHGPLNADGSLAGPFGKVPAEVTVDQAYQSARLVCLAMLGSLKRELGDLDRIGAWLRVFGMVNSTTDFQTHPSVINGCSDLLLEVFGPEVGQHARSAVGLAALPFNIPVEIEAEVELS
jgi:enamine deaminase RidA (YjgF/YER057c/UK114 family)